MSRASSSTCAAEPWSCTPGRSIVPSQVDSAKSGGLATINSPTAFMGVNLADRQGTVAKPLKDQRVRQALNHAVDREAVTKAILQSYGAPTTQISMPGLDGFDAELDKRYPYDPVQGGAPTYLVSLDWLLPHATAFNPYATEDPALSAKLTAAAAAPQDQLPALYQDVMRYVVDQAWFVSVLRTDAISAFNARKVTGFAYGAGLVPDLVWETRPAN